MESGLNEFSVQWAQIQAGVSKFGRACAYDRAGFGWSDASPYPRSSEVMVKELHSLLARAGIEGPYVLVGHSFGGMNMRLYAHHYPSEVAGMVLVDAAHEEQSIRVPALQKAAEQVLGQFRFLARLTSMGILALSPNDIPDRGLTGDALAQYRAILATTHYFDTAIAETEALEKSFSEVRNAKLTLLGNMPLVVLSRGMSDPLPGATESENHQYEQSWKEMQLELVAQSQRGKQIIATQSNHYIHLAQPQLVIDAIQAVSKKSKRTEQGAPFEAKIDLTGRK
jgi:pimeloyl-ACP methyl ester carboxylesterase